MSPTIGIVERMRWMSALVASAVLTVGVIIALSVVGKPLTAPVAAPASDAAGSSSALDPRIGTLAASHPNRVVEAIVQFNAGVAPAAQRADIARAGGRVTGNLHIINGVAAKLTASDAVRLASSGDVHAVSLNAAIAAQDTPDESDLDTTFNQTLGSPALWHLRVGLTGRGIGVAVIDTGIDGNLPDFRDSSGRSRVIATAVTNPDATTVMDTYGHGTHVAGIIAGNSNNRNRFDPLRGKFAGVAPDANLVSIKVSDDDGNATVLDVIYGLQFAVDHQDNYNIRVVNMSLDSTTPQSYKVDPLDAAVESAWFHGLVVVAAAGNRGTDPDAVQYAPANDPYVVTVGAVDTNGTISTRDDEIADWSSRGTTQDGFDKPDVNAPGAHIVSVLAPNSDFATQCPSCIVDGQYISAGGTSMAAPMVSGLVADMLQLHGNWSPAQVKGALISPLTKANRAIDEVSAFAAVLLPFAPVADRGLTPSTLLKGKNGGIDYSRSTWSRSRWSQAQGDFDAGFARSSWSCTCGQGPSGAVDPSRSAWSSSSWAASVFQ
ncbi:MAG TPA: S8 family peptidase [Solirubrobacteraceae bacterium]|jgi:serine protease AprX|nr:S8 family peptidase [Solirubrobacteraceae bacterium]